MKSIFIYVIIFFISISSIAQQKVHNLTATIIGSGSPIYDSERAGPSVLIEYKDTKIIVDTGNGTKANLDKAGVNIKELDGLLYTHHHLDHNEELVPIFIKSLLGNNKFIFAGPPGTSDFSKSIFSLYGEDINYRLSNSNRSIDDVKDNYTVKNLKGGDSFFLGDIKISTVKVNHTIYTIAYRFEVEGQSIVISGDLSYTEDLIGLAQNADYLIIDSGGTIKNGRTRRKGSIKNNGNSNNKNENKSDSHKQRAHVTLDESSRMAGGAGVKNMVLTHFTPGEIDEEATTDAIRENYSGSVLFAYDLMKLPLKVTENNSTNGRVGAAQDRFKSLDKDNNGSLEKSEAQGPLVHKFDKLDINGDKKLTLQEFRNRN